MFVLSGTMNFYIQTFLLSLSVFHLNTNISHIIWSFCCKKKPPAVPGLHSYHHQFILTETYWRLKKTAPKQLELEWTRQTVVWISKLINSCCFVCDGLKLLEIHCRKVYLALINKETGSLDLYALTVSWPSQDAGLYVLSHQSYYVYLRLPACGELVPDSHMLSSYLY